MLAFGDPEFSAVKRVRLLACPIRHAYEDHSLVVFLGRNDEARAWFGVGMNVVREVAPDDVACRGPRYSASGTVLSNITATEAVALIAVFPS